MLTTVGSWLLMIWMGAGASPSKEALYYQAMQSFQKRQYSEAKRSFTQLLRVLRQEQQAQKQGTKAWHLLTFGQADALYHLAQIVWQQAQKQQACLLHQTLQQRLKTLPSEARSWRISRQLRQRLQHSRQHLQGPCQAVPSRVIVDVSPPQARVFLRVGDRWQKQPHTFFTTQTRITLKLLAPGFQEQIKRDLTVQRWKPNTILARLSPAPKPRVRPIPRRQIVIIVPPPQRRKEPAKRPAPTPFFKTWWFWTVTGVVVAGVTTVSIVVAVNNSSTTTHTFQGNQPDQPFKLWP